jgi:predicted transposase YbfD/YdcC
VHETVDKGHGRLEIRKIQTSTELLNYLEFSYHQQVMRIERITLMLKSGKQRHEVVFGITSLSPEQASPQQLLELNRGHWSIENSLHHVRDTTFDEDRSQIRTNKAPQVMATLKNLAISILRLNSYKNISRSLSDLKC